jgi:hypothetical protein
MKLIAAIAIAATATETKVASRVARNVDDSDRRYSQLTDMMEHYNADFDERKYWAYGCNCLILGDRPMSDPGHGPPVDALDTVCKAYKDCVKCARMEFGEMCIGEFVKYKYGYKNGDAVCRDDAGTCDRALCECDAKFAREHVGSKDVFDVKYHMFWSTTNNYPMWDPKNDSSACPTGGAGAYDPQCCQNNAKVRFSTNQKPRFRFRPIKSLDFNFGQSESEILNPTNQKPVF